MHKLTLIPFLADISCTHSWMSWMHLSHSSNSLTKNKIDKLLNERLIECGVASRCRCRRRGVRGLRLAGETTARSESLNRPPDDFTYTYLHTHSYNSQPPTPMWRVRNSIVDARLIQSTNRWNTFTFAAKRRHQRDHDCYE